MTLYEIAFRVQHDCPYNDVSRRHPEALIAQWCNYGIHVFEVSGATPELFQAVHTELAQLGRVYYQAFTGSNVQLVVQTCGCRDAHAGNRFVTPVLEAHHCLEMQPVFYHEGWERYRMLAFDQADVKHVFEELADFCTVEMLGRRTLPGGALRDAFVISTNQLFAGLTAKQTEALRAAFERGYYRVPKHISTEEIAEQVRVPRTTYEEHLRKAESKVLSAIAPYLQLGTGAGRVPEPHEGNAQVLASAGS